MREKRLRPRVWSLLVAACAPAVGCSMMHPSVPVEVTVRDAETKQPIPSAEVALLYPTTNSDTQPHESKATTAPTGNARLTANAGEDAIPQVRIIAAGYLTEEKRLPGDALRALKAADSLWPFSQPAPVTLTLDVYRGPDPTIDLTVPAKWRGQVRVEVRVREDIAYEPQKRTFTAVVPTDGNVVMEGPPVLKRGRGPIFFAHYADEAHTLVPSEAPDDQVAFRWLRTEGQIEVFIIGTKAEFDSYRRMAVRTGGSDSGSGKGGKGGGKKGGGGGGGGMN